MANWTTLKAAINNVIKTNNNQEITGAVLQNTLNSIVNAVGKNATFAGIATPSTNPGAPDGPVFYLASEAGTYSNFNGISIEDGINILLWDGSKWVTSNVYTIMKEIKRGDFIFTYINDTYENDIQQNECVNKSVKCLLFTIYPEENEVFVVSYYSKLGNGAQFQLNVTAYNVVNYSTRNIISGVTFKFDKLNELHPSQNDDTVIGYIYASSSDFTVTVANSGQGLARMPWCNSNCFNRNIQTIPLELRFQELEEMINAKADTEQLFNSDLIEAGDSIKLGYANSAIKELYLLNNTEENVRVVLTYLSKLSGGNYQVGLTLYNTNTKSDTVLADTTGLSYQPNQVTPLYNNQTDREIVGYIIISDADYEGMVANQGEGYKRLPYCGDMCFELSANPEIMFYLNNDTLKTDIIGQVSENYVGKSYIALSEGRYNSDITKQGYVNSCLKALYLQTKPAENERYVITYLGKLNDKFQLGITKYNISDSSTEEIANTTGLTYEWDKVVPLYNNSTKGNVVGYVYASLSDYKGAVANQGEGYARLPYCSDMCFDYLNQPLINNFFIEQDISNIEQTQKKTIVIWGDSITWGSAATADNLCYSGILQKLINENEYNADVINCGVGGENFQNILVRQGAFGFYLADDITIPKLSSEKVAIQTITNYITNEKFKNTWFGNESNFALLLQGETGRNNRDIKTVNPVIVRGVECTMTIDGTQRDATLYLNANKDMDVPLLVKAGTYLYLQGSRIKSDVSIFSIGTNDGWTVKTDSEFDANKSAENYISMIDLAVEKANTNKFIVCSPYGGTALRKAGVEGLKVLEQALAKRYGNRHFNWRKYLIEYGLSDAGISPSDQDTEDISAGKCPTSLLSDGLHPNDAGHKVLGEELYRIMIGLKYLD